MKRSEIKKRPLSDTTLDNLEPDLSINASCYREKDDGNLNLYFRVHKSGKKDWQIRYKKQTGAWNWAGLGGYPETSGKFAREKARAFISDISK
ncbi:MAG TPA: Arm DNA-binding domain-containing protein, partial [Aquirhabdus sp.]